MNLFSYFCTDLYDECMTLIFKSIYNKTMFVLNYKIIISNLKHIDSSIVWSSEKI